MKYLSFIIIILSAQNYRCQDKKICFDSSWMEMKCTANYTFYEIVSNYNENNTIFPVKDYFKSGALQMTGSFSDKDLTVKTGEFKYYKESGNISYIANFSNSKFLGPYKKYYLNGKPEIEGEYKIEDGELSIINYWDEKGNQLVKNGNGNFFIKDEDGSFEKGVLKNGMKSGNWEGFIKPLNYKYEEQYQDDMLIKGIGTDLNDKNKKYPYEEIEVIPYPKKGIDDLRIFVANNTKIPAKTSKKTGTIVIFILIKIDGNGKISKLTSENDVDADMAREVMKTIKKYDGEFILPKYRGHPYESAFRLPVKIVID